MVVGGGWSESVFFEKLRVFPIRSHLKKSIWHLGGVRIWGNVPPSFCQKQELTVSSTPKPSLFTVIKKEYTDTTLCYVKKLFHKPWKLSHPGSNQLFQWHSRHFCGNRCLVLVIFYGVYVPWDSSPSRPTIWGICLFFPSHLKQI